MQSKEVSSPNVWWWWVNDGINNDKLIIVSIIIGLVNDEKKANNDIAKFCAITVISGINTVSVTSKPPFLYSSEQKNFGALNILLLSIEIFV